MALCRLSCKGLAKYRPSCTYKENVVLTLHIQSKFIHQKHSRIKNNPVTTNVDEEEYTETPQYPPILNLRPASNYKRERDFKLDKLKRIGTVEEKFLGVNIPRYYGWSSLILKEGSYPFNFLPFVQHITRTDVIISDKLPFTNALSQSEFDNVLRTIRPQLQEAIIMEMAYKRHQHEVDGSVETLSDAELSDRLAGGVVEQINRILSANLAPHAQHLFQTEIDYEPRIEAFWRVGGFHPNQETYDERKKDIEDHKKELKINRLAKRKIKEEPDDLVGHFIQYTGQPLLQLRTAKPLKPLEPQKSSSETPSVMEPDLKQVPCVRNDPGFYGLEKIRRFGTNIPGFWPGDPNPFGLLSFHGCGHLLGRPPSFGEDDARHTVISQAVLAGYSWLLAQAFYQGFTTFHELTYPLSTTTVVTDGRVFSFFAHQLNTLLMHDEFIDENPKVNVCYALPQCQLYEKIEGSEIIGWNDNTLALLMESYLNTPTEREGVDMTPYLDKTVPLIQHIEHDERRVWLHNNFLYFNSNRPRNKILPEIYDWENIYKVKFQTRPMDAKRKWWEKGIDINPWVKRLDEIGGEYIPRKFRDPANKKKKITDTYWPDA